MDNEYLKRIYGLLESGATLGTGAVSGLVGLPYGLYKGVTSGAYGTPEAPRIAAREAQQFMERNTYQPRTAEGQENLRQLAGLLEASKLPPVMPEASLLAAIPKQAYAAQAERAGMAAEKAIAPVVTRTMERGGLPAQLLGDLSQGSIRPMDVWHGSPHGPFTKFDPSKARTGEGNASYGEGAYLAQARGTGETYRNVLSASKQMDELLQSNDMPTQIAANTLKMYKTPSEAIDVLQSSLTPNLTTEARKATTDAINVLKNLDENAGYLYKVDLPDESIAKMLDYDKPLSKQAPEVQAALAELGISVDKKKIGEYEDALLDALTNPESTGKLPKQPLDLTGEQILKELERNPSRYFPSAMEGKELTGAMINPKSGVSELLSKKGITGVRYLDQMSRDAGEGTSNFVVFPKYQDLLTIKEINDKPVGGLLGQSKAAEATDLLSYRGSHTAPGPDFGAPLHDLTGGGQMYPADVYSSKAAQYYGGGVPYDQKAFDIAQSFKDKPNATVTIYRAVPKEMSNSEKLADIEKQMAAYMKRGTLPKDAENFSNGSKWYDWAYDQREALRNMPDEPAAKIGINSGDWVTLTKEYAKDHGESALNGQYKIISKKVKAKDIWTNADSIHEFGYHPSE